MKIERRRLNKLVDVESPVPDLSIEGAGAGSWEFVTKVWVEIEDVLPSRAERIDTGINLSTRRARIRMDVRSGMDATMRFIHGSRVMMIVAGPVQVNDPEALEFMVEDYSVSGNGA